MVRALQQCPWKIIVPGDGKLKVFPNVIPAQANFVIPAQAGNQQVIVSIRHYQA